MLQRTAVSITTERSGPRGAIIIQFGKALVLANMGAVYTLVRIFNELTQVGLRMDCVRLRLAVQILTFLKVEIYGGNLYLQTPTNKIIRRILLEEA